MKVLHDLIHKVTPTAGVEAQVALLRDAHDRQILDLWRAYQRFYEVPEDEIDEERNRDHIYRIVANPDRGAIFTLSGGDRLIGFATVYFSYSSTAASPIGVINDLFVDPAHRRRGFGRMLLEHCIRYIEQSGVPVAEWATLPSNEQAQALYNQYALPQCWYVYRIPVNNLKQRTKADEPDRQNELGSTEA